MNCQLAMDEQFLKLENSENSYSDALFKKLFLTTDSNNADSLSTHAMMSDGIPCIVIKPKPGFCIKTRTDTGEKVFVNICHSEEVPQPKDLSDDELLQVLEAEDPTQFRIPMAIGEPRAELDKTGGGSTAYDVIIHPNFMKKIEESQLFKTFFLTLMCEGIESKYNILLKRDWIFLKNRKCVGKPMEQRVRTKSTPLIVDMDSPGDRLPEEQPEKRNLITEVQEHEEMLMKKAPEPRFTIIQEPHDNHPEFLVAEIHLPNIKTAQSLTLDVGEDRLLLTTRSHIYHLDIFLPYNLVNEECGAQFDRTSKVLTVTMPVKPVS